MSNLTDLQNRIGETNGKSGFNEADTVPEEYRDMYWERKLLLVVSEIVEAQDELRHGHKITEQYYSGEYSDKPEGAPSEMADAVIRLLGIAYEAKIDLGSIIEEKLAYNATRIFKHGKKF
jgi:NTP pyrophosphatase (non-canonical NTP hydrolase)